MQRSLHSQTFRTLAGERTAGVTLIELLMVIALIAIIFGSGLGMFAGLNPARRATVGLVQNTLRSAHNSSVARQAPARVRFDLASKRKDPDAKLQPDTMTAAGMRVIGTWHFEDDQLRGAFGLDGVNLGGYLVDDGFQGKALSFNGAAPESRIEIGVHQDPAYDFRYGFDIGLALRPERKQGARVLTLGDSVKIETTSRGGIVAYFRAEAVSESGIVSAGAWTVFRTEDRLLQTGAWTRVRVVYDCRVMNVYIDGAPVQPMVAGELAPELEANAHVWKINSGLILGGGQVPFPGAIDQLIVSTVAASETISIPAGTNLADDTPLEIVFAAGGSLDAAVHTKPLVLTVVFDDGTTEDIYVGLYGTVD